MKSLACRSLSQAQLPKIVYSNLRHEAQEFCFLPSSPLASSTEKSHHWPDSSKASAECIHAVETSFLLTILAFFRTNSMGKYNTIASYSWQTLEFQSWKYQEQEARLPHSIRDWDKTLLTHQKPVHLWLTFHLELFLFLYQLRDSELNTSNKPPWTADNPN